MKSKVCVNLLLIGIIITLIYFNFVNYSEYREYLKKNNTMSTNKHSEKKEEENKKSFGYSDIMHIESSNPGIKIVGIENSNEYKKNSVKVNFQYNGEGTKIQNILNMIKNQENLINVSDIKIVYNKETESILCDINAEFIKNK